MITQRLGRVAAVSILGFVVVAVSLMQWAVFSRDDLRARDDNPRRVEDERAIWRGTLYDRSEVVLAQSVPSFRQASGRIAYRREYPHLDSVPVTGYYSLTYGTSGAEFAFDQDLRGANRIELGQAVLNEVLNRPPRGTDIRLTVDQRLQAAAAAAFQGKQGAVIALDASTGAVRLLYSAPTYDPNDIDNDWEALIVSTGGPLLNRALQGRYQPGGALQFIWYAAMLANPQSLPSDLSLATAPVSLPNGATVTCNITDTPTNFVQVFASACPAIFADFVEAYPQFATDKLLAFGMLETPRLDGLLIAEAPTLVPLTELSDQERRLAGIGQGQLTVNLLQMALAMAGIANAGNMPVAYLAEARRDPDAAWETILRESATQAVTTRETAMTIREALAQSAAALGLPENTYGHASISLSGTTQGSWFVGFAVLPNGETLSIATYVEASPRMTAMQISKQILQAALVVQ
ncbi:MAG: penicillin-binding transpeptidase domain-containing protein [Anaerolineae bacterium]